ncbi:hypothetical protein M0R04_14735 [Candidatus Dojkabacteria bacterium]|jgi:hypothetical protein|nr:hypothetical protein [Candidatus Dojkabacteria bacterium]
MDYQNELKRLQEGGNYWKPKVGQFMVKALTELEEAEPYIKKLDNGKEEVNPQFKMRVLVDGEEKLWTFGKGATLASTHGQLVDLAVKNGNKLIGKEFKVVVKSDGKKNDYTIVA